MATGTMKWFAQALLDLGKKKHDLTADVLKIGIVTNTTPPTVGTAVPCWGAGGTTNFSSNQVGTGGTAYTGPKTLASPGWTLVANVATLRADDVALAQDAAGFTNGAYGIIYNDSATNKDCLGWVEVSSGGTASLAAGALTIDWGGAGRDLLTLAQS